MSSSAGIAARTGMPAASAKAWASPVPSSLLMTRPATPTLPPRRRRERRAARGRARGGPGPPCPVVRGEDQPGHAAVPAEPAEVVDRRADVVGDVERLEVV